MAGQLGETIVSTALLPKQVETVLVHTDTSELEAQIAELQAQLAEKTSPKVNTSKAKPKPEVKVEPDATEEKVEVPTLVVPEI